MKTSIAHIITALGLLACGGRTSDAQPLSLSAPIIIQVAEIDRLQVMVFPNKKVMDGALLGLVFADLKQPEVVALVKEGVFWHRSVWVMDGQKIIAEGTLAGGTEWEGDESEYGITLSFKSVVEAEKIAARFKPPAEGQLPLEEMIRRYKSRLDDKRFWNDF